MLESIASRGDEEDRVRARVALALSAGRRSERQVVARFAAVSAVDGVLVPAARKVRTVFDAGHSRELPGRIVRAEGQRRTGDAAVDEAYDYSGRTYDFFRRVHGRRSLDDRGLRLESTVHYGERFNNAHWNGRQMICGDGDGKYFQRFTSSLDVVAHELTHGVTQYAAGFAFTGQGGALAEHFSDVFGVLVKQYSLGQTAAEADWLVGAELFTPRVNGSAIRSMKAPGSAYDDPILGKDPQPSHMRDYKRMRGNNRGVHVNSGIPNHAFYQVTTLLGGRAWEVAGRIWYAALTRELGPRSRFQHCADATWRAAGALYGRGAAAQEAVLVAWKAVGIDVSASVVRRGPRLRVRGAREPFDPPAPGADRPSFVF